MRLGILGGTFNPIHLGHLLLAETARETLQLDRVLFIPVRQPPHKPSRGLLPETVRLRLIRLAIRGRARFAASEMELKRPGPSYSIDTVRILRRRFPQAELFLLIGEDMLSVRWHAWDTMRRLCTIVVACRPGWRMPRRDRFVRRLAMPQVDICSSEIRRRVRAGRSIRYLVPAAVERELITRRLYQ